MYYALFFLGTSKYISNPPDPDHLACLLNTLENSRQKKIKLKYIEIKTDFFPEKKVKLCFRRACQS